MSNLLTMSSFGGFPKSFLSSLKVLFDILDDRGTGYVKLADIEERWRDDGSVDSLPPGVTTALRKVAPPDGKLTFEIFVAGLRMALLHDRSEPEPRHSDHDVKVGRKEPIPPPYHAKTPTVNSTGHKSGTLNNVPLMTKQRAFSMPQLDGKLSYPQNGHGDNTGGTRCESTSSTDQQYFRSLKQQATNRPSGAEHSSNKNGGEPDMLTRWQQQLKSGDQEKRWSEKQSNFRKPGDGKSSTSSSSALEQYSGVAGDVAQAKGRGNPAPPGSQRTVKRRDSRRHTLANGVDFNMIKRMKQLERERDVLLQGLEMVDRARTWYQKQLCSVQEKQRSAAAQNDQSLEAHQERISLQMARIFEVNQQLKALVDSSEKGLPFHMNLAVSGPGRPHQNSLNHATELKEKDTTIGRLKSQNRMLTQEVSTTSEKVTQLEQEKRQLIRELFEARAHKHNSESKTHSYDDTTFI